VAICVVFVPAAAVGAVGTPVRAGEAIGALSARALVTVPAKLESSFKAAANSFKVFSVAGEESIKLDIAVDTSVVLAIFEEI